MALKALISKSEYESLSDELKNEYVTNGDQYKLDVTPAGNLKLEDVTGLNNSLQNAKKERNEYKKKVEAFGDLTPEDAIAAKKVADELGGMSLDEKTQAAVKQREEALATAHKKELGTVTSRAASAESQLQKALVDNKVREKLTPEITDHPDLLVGFVTERVQMKRVEDTGQYVPVVLDINGNPAVADGQGTPLSLDGLIEEFRNTEKFAPLFKGTGSKGTGSKGSGSADAGSGGGKQITVSRSQMEQGQFGSLEDLAAGDVQFNEG